MNERHRYSPSGGPRQDNALRILLIPVRIAALGMLASSAWLACSPAVSEPASGGAGGTPTVPATGGARVVDGALPVPSAAGATTTETGGSAGAPFGGSSAAGAPASGGADGMLTGGTSSGGSAGTAAAGSASGGSGDAPPSNCNLSAPVSFQKDIQGFLAKSCGKTVDGGCHVTDSSKTSLGYDHAYDWITAFAHPSSCGRTSPYAKRFEVVLALVNGPKPANCPNSRQMPPDGMAEPLTACQLAALQAWLAEPLVSQQHVPVSDDTKALYPEGPYLMPPFN